MGAYSTLWDITGPYRTLEDLTGPYGTILDHKGPKGTFGDHTGPYGTICITSHCKIMQLQTFWLLTDLLTDLLTHAISRGACAPKKKRKENNDENSGPLTSLPVERLTACSTATPPLVPIGLQCQTQDTPNVLM